MGKPDHFGPKPPEKGLSTPESELHPEINFPKKLWPKIYVPSSILPAGKYSEPIVIDFLTPMDIVGETLHTWPNQGPTVIETTHNGPAIIIRNSRGITLRGIEIRHKHIGIEIDDKSATMASFAIHIEGCSVLGGDAGIVAGNSQKEDVLGIGECSVRDCVIEGAQIGFASGHHQTKAWVCDAVQITRCGVAYDNTQFGIGGGFLPFVRGGEVTFSNEVVKHGWSGWAPINFSGLYTEKIKRIGSMTGGSNNALPATFSQCQFMFDDVGPSTQEHHLMAKGLVTFSGCYFHSLNPHDNTGWRLKLKDNRLFNFIGCHFHDVTAEGNIPPVEFVDFTPMIRAIGCTFRPCSGFHAWNSP
jgi:hypothetical protein